MIRSIFLLCAGLIALTGIAHAQTIDRAQQSGQPGSRPPAVSKSLGCKDASDAETFKNAVKVLKLPFVKDTKHRPEPVDGDAVPMSIKDDLRDAFSMAPKFFRERLCQLNGLFLTSAGDSWGFRLNSNKDEKYIAISMDLWGNGGAPAYSAFEEAVLQRLLKDWKGPKHGSSDNDASATTVLAVLAHEYGHILWYDTFVSNPGDAANFDSFCVDGGKGQFYLDSWDTIDAEPPISRWRRWDDFTAESFSSKHKSGDVKTEEILHAVPPDLSDSKEAGKKLARVYGHTDDAFGRWASLLATFSAEEDFVETFKLFVLQNADPPLTSLPISIPIPRTKPIQDDIPKSCKDKGRAVLQKKLACFMNAFCKKDGAAGCDRTCPH